MKKTSIRFVFVFILLMGCLFHANQARAFLVVSAGNVGASALLATIGAVSVDCASYSGCTFKEAMTDWFIIFVLEDEKMGFKISPVSEKLAQEAGLTPEELTQYNEKTDELTVAIAHVLPQLKRGSSADDFIRLLDKQKPVVGTDPINAFHKLSALERARVN